MRRKPEPELMDDAEQAQAYAQADFRVPHEHFIDLLAARCSLPPAGGRALDLGCGAADPGIRFARRFPAWELFALDGAEAMLQQAQRSLLRAGLHRRVRLLHGLISESEVLDGRYDCLFSNSLLHHLPEPGLLWQCLRRHGTGARVFVMDLLRPSCQETLDGLVEQYAGAAPAVLQRDFRRSLAAAYTPDEIGGQLQEAGLGQLVREQVSDRHVIIHGCL